MEPGEAGGGGVGPSDPETSGYGIDFGDFTSELEREIDRVNEQNRIDQLATERAEDRPGRFGITSSAFAPPSLIGPNRTLTDRLRDFGTWLAQQAVSRIPGIGTVAGVAIPAIKAKIQGKTAEEIDRIAFSGIMNNIAPWAAPVVTVAQWADKMAGKMGMTGNPDVSFGQDQAKAGPSDRGLESIDVADNQAAEFAASQHRFSDGSVLIMNPKDQPAQQPRTVALRQGKATGDRREQIDQLLRRARAGRIS